MGAIHAAMTFDADATEGKGGAGEAFALRRGGARDYAHIFIACARWLGVPARFVSGYLAPRDAPPPQAHLRLGRGRGAGARLDRVRSCPRSMRRRRLRARRRRLRRARRRPVPRRPIGGRRRGGQRGGDDRTGRRAGAELRGSALNRQRAAAGGRGNSVAGTRRSAPSFAWSDISFNPKHTDESAR